MKYGEKISIDFIFCAFVALLVVSALFVVFFVAPEEKELGIVQKIFYFHVGSAISCYVLIGGLFFCSLAWLFTKDRKWEEWGAGFGVLAFISGTTVLVTGMIWGKASWNTWWRWEPRLVSMLVLWMLLLGWCVLRQFVEGDRKLANASSVLAIIIAFNVPLVMFSVRFLEQKVQLHPEIKGIQGLEDDIYVLAFILSIFACLALNLLLVRLCCLVNNLDNCIKVVSKKIN